MDIKIIDYDMTNDGGPIFGLQVGDHQLENVTMVFDKIEQYGSKYYTCTMVKIYNEEITPIYAFELTDPEASSVYNILYNGNFDSICESITILLHDNLMNAVNVGVLSDF
jgi:hypothetical protein